LFVTILPQLGSFYANRTLKNYVVKNEKANSTEGVFGFIYYVERKTAGIDL
jgi:hypothetical protein